ncbi:hypothetical protein [Microbacterium sp. W4I20]|uniref:hypothetical protein n=1 Tax=Microbacterium sp. W4I20 TaxID=3042262 RepID=UPI0027D88CA1|nr:hypothetical protein [Microbacterium sp. W4I20]
MKPGKAEQKYDIDLVEGGGRVWRPPPTVVRLLIAAWGDESDVWIGRRVTLKLDETVRFGPEEVGGIRISHLSHIGKTMKIASTVKRGKKTPVIIEPLPDVAPVAAPPADAIPKAIAAIHNAATIAELDKIEKYATSLGIHANDDLAATLDIKRGELS